MDQLHRHRQAHTLQTLGGDRRAQEPGAGHRRRRDVHRDRADRGGGHSRVKFIGEVDEY